MPALEFSLVVNTGIYELLIFDKVTEYTTYLDAKQGIKVIVLSIKYYTFLKNAISSPFIAADITADDGVRTRVQTSGIETTTGILHVLLNGNSSRSGHLLYFSQKRN